MQVVRFRSEQPACRELAVSGGGGRPVSFSIVTDSGGGGSPVSFSIVTDGGVRYDLAQRR